MIPDVVVVMAYRDMGVPERAASYVFVRERYRHLGLPVMVASGADEATFTRARALNSAINAVTAPIIIQSDPDSLVPWDVLAEAIELARLRDGLIVPHDRYLYLRADVTRQVLAGRQLHTVGPDDCETAGTNGVGNVTVFSRDTWVRARGYDEAFGVWGGDDAAFAYAAEALVAPTRRLPGDMTHLWHPRLPQSDPANPGYVEQFAILARYRDAAAAGPHAVRALVNSR